MVVVSGGPWSGLSRGGGLSVEDPGSRGQWWSLVGVVSGGL